MNRLICVIVLVFLAAITRAQSLPEASSPSLDREVYSTVSRLYTKVMQRKPLGLLGGKDRQIFTSYLSRGLRAKMNSAQLCQADWTRQEKHKPQNDVPEKSPIAWSETGLFTGDEQLAEPSSFVIEKTEPQKDGSFLVYVKLTGGAPPHTPWNWEVAVRVVKEDHPAIDDVTYLKGSEIPNEYHLSSLLREGCDGPRWVGVEQKLPRK